MQPASVVLYHKDAGTARTLISRLSEHLPAIHVARTCEEIRPTIARHRAQVLVLDLESSCLKEVERLHHEFPALSIVCTHRLADDELWTAALNQGAADVCEPQNADDIVRAVVREQGRAAAA
jgi:DNA-binding NtrC family response regulator